MSGRGSARKKNFKKGIDSDDSRRKREETRIVVRKEKRDEVSTMIRVVVRVDTAVEGSRVDAGACTPLERPGATASANRCNEPSAKTRNRHR